MNSIMFFFVLVFCLVAWNLELDKKNCGWITKKSITWFLSSWIPFSKQTEETTLQFCQQKGGVKQFIAIRFIHMYKTVYCYKVYTYVYNTCQIAQQLKSKVGYSVFQTSVIYVSNCFVTVVLPHSCVVTIHQPTNQLLAVENDVFNTSRTFTSSKTHEHPMWSHWISKHFARSMLRSNISWIRSTPQKDPDMKRQSFTITPWMSRNCFRCQTFVLGVLVAPVTGDEGTVVEPTGGTRTQDLQNQPACFQILTGNVKCPKRLLLEFL